MLAFLTRVGGVVTGGLDDSLGGSVFVGLTLTESAGALNVLAEDVPVAGIDVSWNISYNFCHCLF